MRRILIVGSGQSGLQLAHSLLDAGCEVTVVSARTPEEIRSGRVMSTQCMFHTALQHERDLGLNMWEEDAPKIAGVGVSVAGPDGSRPIDWLGRLDGYAQSVDQRVKMADWLESFEDDGGRVIISGATVSDLEGFTEMFDLVVVAAGRGELTQLFDVNHERTVYSEPQRALSVAYVHGQERRPEHPELPAVRCNLVPGVGELFAIPGYTLSGPCDILFFEGIPGGPLDVFEGVKDPRQHLDRMLELMRTYLPWEHARCGGVELTDDRAVLAGRFTPLVRDPVGRLGNGTLVFGMADVVVANDPITGQGSNSAAKCAAAYHAAIVEHGDRPFDEAFMRATFEKYWSYARHVTAWTNAMLQPPPPHVLEVLGAAGEHAPVADRFANGFDDPTDFATWFLDPEGAAGYLAEAAGGAARARGGGE
ncbi:styrene monooxygenase/indole monooxygenase family protein [Allosalinactinospora lopnorensis]|uniref:styrene monooxygenase/indole monooxygenase family protein n=1 Tax=Allosalinactinospora lopnorensis TaxID=1352348 RepID=UPI000623D17B|nr:styrene monooxygenase/indole monooxygenase family protein [Allosalinactinospora lopnorensis]